MEFTGGACALCHRPVIEDHTYLDDIEELASLAVNAAYDEWDTFSLSEDSTGGLRGAIARLGAALRHYHYEDDGCLDGLDDPSSDPSAPVE